MKKFHWNLDKGILEQRHRWLIFFVSSHVCPNWLPLSIWLFLLLCSFHWFLEIKISKCQKNLDCNALWRLFAGARSICISESVEWCATDWIKFHSFNDCTTWGKGFCITPAVTIGSNNLWKSILNYPKFLSSVYVSGIVLWLLDILIGQLSDNWPIKMWSSYATTPHASDINRWSQLKLSIDIRQSFNFRYLFILKFHKHENKKAPSE